ncbi:GxxExxY protein [Ruficoccus sp. ZRK36]|uniref:GxxExxY protein n=1 Tax=Ruficoccus sp. ZRK36 TaxID=2866311 RepID=UPI001C737453|nr:GxxExxY protein [Ruficoccus sp. ZRK36]QYY34357.1 GxxExxY protein [Ruficoccus sp. ZRK36]
MDVEAAAGTVIDAAIEVHRLLGPGLLENAYELCLAHELSLRGVSFVRQKCLPVVYKDYQVEDAYRVDLLVENCLLVELKSVEKMTDVHMAQVLTYLKLSDLQLGLLLNFNTTLMKHGIRRVVHNYHPSSSCS